MNVGRKHTGGLKTLGSLWQTHISVQRIVFFFELLSRIPTNRNISNGI